MVKKFREKKQMNFYNSLGESYGYDYDTYGYTVSFTIRIPDISDRMQKSRGLQDLLNKHLNNIKDSVDYYDTDFEVINGTGYFYITISNSVDFYYALEYLEKYAIGFDYDSRKMSREDVIEKYVTQKYGWREDFKIKDIEKVSTVHYQESRKVKESLSDKEKLTIVHKRTDEIERLFRQESIWAEEYNFSYKDTYYTVSFEIDGDWKHDHQYANHLVREYFGDKLVNINQYEIGDSQSDDYDGVHEYTFRY